MLGLAIRNTNKLIREKSKSENVRLGRFFTKKDSAALMASMIELDKTKTSFTVLDPGAGTGILSAAIIEKICTTVPSCKNIILTCYEDDPVFFPLLEDNLERIRKKCRHDYGVRLFVTLYNENYLTDVKNHYTVSLYGAVEDKFDIIICNPPSHLIDKGSDEAEAVGGVTMLKINAAFLFTKVAAEHLEYGGQLCIMLPTTIATASSLSAFRSELNSLLSIRSIHLFIGAQKNAKRAIPLKKELIICYKNTDERADIAISTSTDAGTDKNTQLLPPLPYDFVVDAADGSLVLPKSSGDVKIVRFISSFPETLHSLGLKMSTGLIIDSKYADLLHSKEDPGTIPVIRSSAMQNGGIRFPAQNTSGKQYLMPTVPSLFQRNKNMIIIKRIPAKSDERFLNCAMYFAGQRPNNQYISTHNKINFIDTKNMKDEMSARFTFGLFAILNSTIYDRYISILSKSKQINSKELKFLRLPPRTVIENIGFRLMSLKQTSVAACDSIVNPTFHIKEK